LSAIEVLDAGKRVVHIGAGARWANVADALAPRGWAISSGDHGNVGVGGLATAGGIGWLARSSGLTLDHVRAVDVLLADGRRVRADDSEEPDLFWAMRGAGDSVGVALGFVIEATVTSEVGVGQIVVEADRSGGVLRRWSEYTSRAPRELSTAAILMRHQGGFVMQITAVVASDDPAVIRRLIAPLAKIGRSVDEVIQLAPYTALMSRQHLHANVGQQPVIVTNALLATLTSDSARAIMDAAAHPSGPLVQLRSLGGAINDVAADATAYAHRHQQALAILSQFPPGDGRQLDDAWRSVEPYAEGAYRSFESRPDSRTLRLAFPAATGERVLALRNRFDPDGVFRRLEE
jgi:FAD/FMN-containing dehydrogenase